jgi:phosphatidylglycerophosphatase A
MKVRIKTGGGLVMVPNVRFLFSHLAHFISLGFGSGLIPLTPGTMGTLAGWMVYAGLTRAWPQLFTPTVWSVMIVAGFLIGIWACERTGRDMGKPDHGSMVWDEMVAFWLVLVFITPASLVMQLAAFLLFRFFDIVKPPPIRYFDGLWKGGFGVMWDDVLAAFYTLLVLAIWRTVLG